LTRKRGLLTHPGSLILAAAALTYTAYIFGYIPQDMPDKFFGYFSNRHDLVVGQGGMFVEVALGVGALLVVYTFVMPILRYSRRRRR
jgi:hypothetical protein